VSDEVILEVMTPEKDSQSGTILIFPIRLVESAALWDRESIESHVELSCRKTGQKVRLPVSVRLIGQRPEHFGEQAIYLQEYLVFCMSCLRIGIF
jgi:hypothetical protein